MKIVIAPDSFKGSLTALEVATAIESGVLRVLPRADCVKVPMADGGEGTVQSLVDAGSGSFVRKSVTGPLGLAVRARYGFIKEKKLAVIEMAEASGLPLVGRRKPDPMRATSYGTGELILDAIERGARRIIVGIGGSATTDAGTGMAQALGVRFLDGNGRLIRMRGCGAMLTRIRDIDMENIDTRVARTQITVACDVDNPLWGRRGAARVFGPQKGANPQMVKELDKGLRQVGRVIRSALGMDVVDLAGAGAAGGLGAGLVAFAGAKLESGVDIVMEAVGLAASLKDADLVITGEGRIDDQTPFGKAPAGVARLAGRRRVPVVAIGGGLADGAREVFNHGIDGIEAAIARDMTMEEALEGAEGYIADAAERALRLVLLGRDLRAR